MSVASLSLLAAYDDFVRLEKVLLEGSEQEFIRFALSQEECRLQWQAAVTECLRLQEALTKSQRELTSSEDKLQIARRLLDQEKKKCRRVEMENHCLEKQVAMIRDLLMPQQNKLNDETKEKLAFLNSTLRGGKSSFGYHDEDRLKTIAELDTTGSILSDLSISRSEDDLDTSYLRSGKRWKARPSLEDDSRSAKRRRSSHSSGSRRKVEVKAAEHVIATTTVRVSREGPITATSKIEAEQQNMKAPPPPLPKRKPEPSAPPMSEIFGEAAGYPATSGKLMQRPQYNLRDCHLPSAPSTYLHGRSGWILLGTKLNVDKSWESSSQILCASFISWF